MVKRLMLAMSLVVGFSGTTECMNEVHKTKKLKKEQREKSPYCCRNSSALGLWSLVSLVAFGCIVAPRVLMRRSDDGKDGQNIVKFKHLDQEMQRGFDREARDCDGKHNLREKLRCQTTFMQEYSDRLGGGVYAMEYTPQVKQMMKEMIKTQCEVMDSEGKIIKKKRQECLKLESESCKECLEDIYKKHVKDGAVKEGLKTPEANMWVDFYTQELNENQCKKNYGAVKEGLKTSKANMWVDSYTQELNENQCNKNK